MKALVDVARFNFHFTLFISYDKGFTSFLKKMIIMWTNTHVNVILLSMHTMMTQSILITPKRKTFYHFLSLQT